jgi:hypothetical protein
MGHELAHLTKSHVVGERKGDTAVLLLSFGRDQEIEADVDGMRFAVAAGFPYKKGISKAFTQMRATTKYSSFEGLSATHPSWEERLVLLDRAQAKLWASMAAFQNGRVFLEMEQYIAAQQCFKAVVAEFPDCPEAWANLGYARLMLYCDGLDPDDLKRYGIGQIVTGGFYARRDQTIVLTIVAHCALLFWSFHVPNHCQPCLNRRHAHVAVVADPCHGARGMKYRRELLSIHFIGSVEIDLRHGEQITNVGIHHSSSSANLGQSSL